MTRDIINVQYPVVESTQSVATAEMTKSTVVAANGVTVKEAFKNKNNSLFICVENSGNAAGTVTFLAGDVYPNSMLGKLVTSVGAGKTVMLQVQDISRFENKDGSLNLDFSTGFTGTIYAVAKSVALNK